MYEQITDLMRDPAAGQDQKNYMTILAARREKVIALIDELLKAHPETNHRDELMTARLESMYITTVVGARPLDALEAEAERILSGRPSPALAAYAAYLKMRTSTAAHRRKLRKRILTTSQPTTAEVEADHRRFQMRRYVAYVEEHPKSRFAPAILADIIRDAWRRQDPDTADRYVAVLKSDHPRHVETEGILAARRARTAIGKPFELTFVGTTGERISTRTMRGHVVVVHFWATWCPKYRSSIRRLKSMRERLHARGLRIIGISLDESRSALAEFVDEEAITWPQYFDGKQWASKVVKRCGVQAVPAMYVVDKSGILRAIRLDGVDALVERLLAEDSEEKRSRRP